MRRLAQWQLFLLLTVLANPTTAEEVDSVIQIGGEMARLHGTVNVEDKNTNDGFAFRSTVGIHGPMVFAYSDELMGIFEAKFRMKVADNSKETVVAHIRYWCYTTEFHNLPADVVDRQELKGSDFAASNTYQEFTVRWVAPHHGRNGWSVHTSGEAAVWIDQITVRRVRDVTEQELLGWTVGQKPPGEPSPRQGPWRAHLTRGMYSDFYLFDLALPRIPGLRVTSSSFNTTDGAPGHPKTDLDLYQNDVLIMAGTDISHLSMSMRVAIMKWVAAGGSLLWLGGPRAFAPVQLEKSMLNALLPITANGRFNLQRTATEIRPRNLKAPLAAGIDWSKPFLADFRHHVTVRPGAEVLLGNDTAPVLVVRKHEQGRVACFLTPPMGRNPDGFWNDPRTPQLMANIVRSLITRPAPDHPQRWQADGKSSAAAEALLERMSTGGLDDDDDLALGDDDDDNDEGGENAPLSMTAESLTTLTEGGGAAAVPYLLRTLPTLTEKADIHRVQRALHRHLDKNHGEKVEKLTKHMQADIRNVGIGLLGVSGLSSQIGRFTKTEDAYQQRAVCRAILDGSVRRQLPHLKSRHAKLKAMIADLKLQNYGGYWRDGLRPDDPAWAYAECTMGLLTMGESGYLKEAIDLLFLLHLEDMKIRTFIFNYSDMVPREIKMSKHHKNRNDLVQPDLTDLLERLSVCLANLPDTLHDEFAAALLAVNDHEKMIRPLYAAHVLFAKNPKHLNAIDAHAFKLALAATRW